MNGQQVQDTAELPTSYQKHLTLDFRKDRKIAGLIRGIFLGVALIAVAVALLIELPMPGWSPWITVPVTVLASLLYMAAHEATHGVTLQLLTGTHASYVVRFPFLVASSPLYLTRRSIIMTALAPCIIWGVVLAATLLFVPLDLYLMFYILLALNFAGSAGDYVEAALALRQPKEALLHDQGDHFHVFLPSTTAPN